MQCAEVNMSFNIDDFILEQLKLEYQQQIEVGCFSGTFEEYKQNYLNREAE